MSESLKVLIHVVCSMRINKRATQHRGWYLRRRMANWTHSLTFSLPEIAAKSANWSKSQQRLEHTLWLTVVYLHLCHSQCHSASVHRSWTNLNIDPTILVQTRNSCTCLAASGMTAFHEDRLNLQGRPSLELPTSTIVQERLIYVILVSVLPCKISTSTSGPEMIAQTRTAEQVEAVVSLSVTRMVLETLNSQGPNLQIQSVWSGNRKHTMLVHRMFKILKCIELLKESRLWATKTRLVRKEDDHSKNNDNYLDTDYVC